MQTFCEVYFTGAIVARKSKCGFGILAINQRFYTIFMLYLLKKKLIHIYTHEPTFFCYRILMLPSQVLYTIAGQRTFQISNEFEGN